MDVFLRTSLVCLPGTLGFLAIVERFVNDVARNFRVAAAESFRLRVYQPQFAADRAAFTLRPFADFPIDLYRHQNGFPFSLIHLQLLLVTTTIREHIGLKADLQEKSPATKGGAV
jgi:hypothetical protein